MAPAGDLRGGSRNRALRQTGRPPWGVAIVLLAIAVPATVLEQRVGVSSGIVVLASRPGWSRRRGRSRAATAARSSWGAVVLVAAAAAGAGGAPSSSAVDWKNWDLYSHARGQVGVGYVWAANYNGIRFPEKPTTVLRVRVAAERATGAPRPWMPSKAGAGSSTSSRCASTLHGTARSKLCSLRRRTTRPAVRQQVEVVGLRSNRLPAASTPVALESSSLARVSFLGGVLGYREGVAPGQRYTVWSHVPRPQPAQLAASRPGIRRRPRGT